MKRSEIPASSLNRRAASRLERQDRQLLHVLRRFIAGFIPFLNQPITLSASLAVQQHCLRFAFAYSID